MAPDAQTPQAEGRHRQAHLTSTEDEHEEPERVRLITVPDSLRAADISVGARAVRGLVFLVVVGALALGVRWWWVEQHASAVPVDVEQAWSGASESDVEAAEDEENSESLADPAASTTAPPAGSQELSADLMVHVIGQVHDPGVVQLPPGSRVVDAVQAAGGLTDQADAGSVNLARAVLDGEQVWVGQPGEEPPAAASIAGQTTGSVVGDAGAASHAAGGAEAVLLDLNTATQAQLEELPGVGPVTAERILTWRTDNGQFTDTTELLEVSGIGERTLEQLEPLVRVGG